MNNYYDIDINNRKEGYVNAEKKKGGQKNERKWKEGYINLR